jgi:hypothetical protein
MRGQTSKEHVLVRVLLLFCIGFVVASYGCNGSDGDSDTGGIFITSLYVLDTGGQEKSAFSLAQQIQFELNVLNTSSSSQTLYFSSGQMYEFIVREAGTPDVIWRWSHDRAFTQHMHSLTFESGERKTFSALWDQTDSRAEFNGGVQVDPGVYEAQGNVVDQGDSDQYFSSLVQFEILE